MEEIRGQTAWVELPTLLLTSCMTKENLTVLYFKFLLYKGDND